MCIPFLLIIWVFMFTEHLQGLCPRCAKHCTCTKQESTLKVLQIKTDSMEHGKMQISLFYREGIEAQILQNASCFMHLNITEISVSQTPKCFEHLRYRCRCRCPCWPEPAPHNAVEVSQTHRAGMGVAWLVEQHP